METERSVGFADYVAAFHRRRLLMFGIALPIVIISALVALALPSIYRSSAMFRLRDADSDPNRMRYVDKYISGLRDYVLRLPRTTHDPADVHTADVRAEM